MKAPLNVAQITGSIIGSVAGVATGIAVGLFGWDYMLEALANKHSVCVTPAVAVPAMPPLTGVSK